MQETSPIIETKISFKEFKETSHINKYGQSGFILLFGMLKYGWKYRIMLRGSNKLCALRAAYFLLYGNTDSDEKQEVSIHPDADGGFKIPLQANFSFSFRSDLFDTEWFKICMAQPKIDLEESK